MNVVELSVRGEYGVFTQSVADRTMLPIYATTGKWNHEMNERLTAFFSKDGGTYVDVGANIGLTLVPLAQNPNVDIIAFEPDPSNFHYLSRNVADNCKHANITLHQLAAFREKTQLKFELSPAGHENASAFTDKLLGGREADPAAGASYDGDLVGKFLTHGRSPYLIGDKGRP